MHGEFVYTNSKGKKIKGIWEMGKRLRWLETEMLTKELGNKLLKSFKSIEIKAAPKNLDVHKVHSTLDVVPKGSQFQSLDATELGEFTCRQSTAITSGGFVLKTLNDEIEESERFEIDQQIAFTARRSVDPIDKPNTCLDRMISIVI